MALATTVLLQTCIIRAAVPADSPLRRAPKITTAATALPQPKLLGKPEYALYMGWTRAIQKIHDGRTLVAASPGENEGSRLYFIDAATLAADVLQIPKDRGSASCVVVGSDGNLYLPPHNDGCMYRVDSRTRQITRIDVGYPKDEMTWGSVAASNGRIYFGSYPTASVAEFDPKTEACTIWRQTVPDTRYALYFSEDQAGKIHFLASHPETQWMEFDPGSRQLRHGKRVGTPPRFCGPPFGVPAPPAGDAKFAHYLRAQGRFFAISQPTGRFWELTKAAAEGGETNVTLRGETTRPVEKWKLEETGDAVVGISDYGVLFRYDLGTGTFTLGRLPNTTQTASHVMYLETVSPRCVVLSPGISKGFTLLDPETGKMEQIYGMFHQKGVQGQCAVALNGTLYMGLYGGAVLMSLDPAKPYKWQQNPHLLMSLAEDHAQTRPRQAATDGSRIFFSTDGAYGVLGGALAVIEPASEAVQVFQHPVKDQNLPSIAWDPSTGLLWGSTWRWGTSKSCPPTQPSSLVFAFDLAAGKTVFEQVLWPGSDLCYVAGIHPSGILAATGNGELVLMDTGSRDILFQGKIGIPPPSRLRQGADGNHYFLNERKLWQWNLPENTIKPVAQTDDLSLATEASPGTWVLAGKQGIFSVHIQEPQN